jgi:hypothetical protein
MHFFLNFKCVLFRIVWFTNYIKKNIFNTLFETCFPFRKTLFIMAVLCIQKHYVDNTNNYNKNIYPISIKERKLIQALKDR